MNILNMTALQVGEKIKNKEISCVEVVKYFFENMKNKSNGYITLTEEYAINKAKEIQSKINKGEQLSIFAGVPISVKDNICTKNIKTTCASKMLKDFVPPFLANVKILGIIQNLLVVLVVGVLVQYLTMKLFSH